MKLQFLVPVLIAAVFAALSGIGPLQEVDAQSRVTPVTNIHLSNGANPGEVVISWDIVPQATHYRIGYVNMETDYPLAKASTTGDWINAFIYVDEDARNLHVANGRAQYTVRRLGQGVRHAFTVLSAAGIVNTRQDLIGSYSWPQNPRWQFLEVTDRRSACPTTPPTTVPPNDGALCPITGLPIPPGGYLGVGDTKRWVSGLLSFRLDSATTPTSVELLDGSLATPVAGTKYLRLCGTLINNLDFPFYFQPGVQNNLSTDRGLGFVDVLGWPEDPVASGGQGTGCDVWEIPVAAQTAVYAVLSSDPDDDFTALFQIELPAN